MKQMLIIPDRNDLNMSFELAGEYGLGFEYNDFFVPDVLDDEKRLGEIVQEYQERELPRYCTLHGAFFDVIPFSLDARIREIAELRIEQSMETAKRIGAKAVVFHTNYTPFLNSESYIQGWIDVNTLYWSSVLERHSEINIYLENMFDTTPDVLEALSKRLCRYANYGVCLDYAHAFLSNVPPQEWGKCLGRFVKHVHLNDNDGVSDLHLAWGDGVIDRTAFYDCYETYMKGATVLLETSQKENIIRSLTQLRNDGFLDL